MHCLCYRQGGIGVHSVFQFASVLSVVARACDHFLCHHSHSHCTFSFILDPEGKYCLTTLMFVCFQCRRVSCSRYVESLTSREALLIFWNNSLFQHCQVILFLTTCLHTCYFGNFISQYGIIHDYFSLF